jgi:DNA-binding beta-propeller fold protein YncE
LRGPQYITTDADRYLYVTDWGNRRVVKYNYDGDYVLSFGEATGEFSGFSEPTGIAFEEGRIYVADRARQAIYIFDESGNFLSGIADIGLQSPESIEVFGPNRLLVSDSSRLLLVNTQDETVSEFSEVQNYSGRVTSAALDANGRIIAADFDQNRLLFLSEISSLYSGLFVRIERVNATQFPTVYVDVAVENRLGRPIVGLETRNFFLSENRQAMANPEVVWAAHRSSESEVSVLIERSPMVRRQQDRMEDLASQLDGLRQGDLSMRVISAGESATVEANPGVSGTRFTEAVRGSGYSSAWSFDSGLRFAASELIPVRKSRAVIYVSSGRLPDDAFDEYGLEVLAQYMKNNHIQFFPVYLTQDAVPDELQFLARETGGQSYYLYNPEGIGGIREDIRRHQSGRYTIRAQSRSASDFGRAYIPFEIEAYLIRQSGRDEAGYYAPLQF